MTQGEKVETVKICMSINNLYGKCKFQQKFNHEERSEDFKEGELEHLTDYEPANLVFKLHKIKMKIMEMKFIKNKLGTIYTK